MNIGYSFWGFLGDGIVDTPDGGRGHRRNWLRELSRRGHTLVLLQKNRDRLEAADNSMDAEFRWASDDFPPIDLLFLEWRWPIPGRNVGTECGDPSHTCDLHRQQALLAHYTFGLRTPTLIWDKDLRVDQNSEIRLHSNIRIAETAWFPRPGSIRLQIPVLAEALDMARAEFSLGSPTDRELSLIYVGNQYERDERFNEYFAVPATHDYRHAVIGKWTATSAWPWVRFLGRQSFSDSMAAYRNARATIALLPQRYEAVGQTVQRIAEAVTRGCVVFVPATVHGAELCTPRELIVCSGAEVRSRLSDIENLSPASYADLRGRSIDMLEPLRADVQYDNLAIHCDWFAGRQ